LCCSSFDQGGDEDPTVSGFNSSYAVSGQKHLKLQTGGSPNIEPLVCSVLARNDSIGNLLGRYTLHCFCIYFIPFFCLEVSMDCSCFLHDLSGVLSSINQFPVVVTKHKTLACMLQCRKMFARVPAMAGWIHSLGLDIQL
jgi:hypothetical protein